jgi:S1-C subfamily serine protease
MNMKRIVASFLAATLLVFFPAAVPAHAATTSPLRTAEQQLLLLLLQELALLEQQLAAETPTPSPPPGTSAAAPVLPPEISFDPQALVGVLCYYRVTATDPANGETTPLNYREEVRGSGVIINANGDILTNRHIVEQPSSTTTFFEGNGDQIPVTLNYSLDHCEVGQLPAGTSLPSASEIQSINPYVQIPVLGYTAQPLYVSNDPNPQENNFADFAVLGITGITANGPTFGITSVPASFPYATLLPIAPYVVSSTALTLPGNVLTYGFPGDVTSGQGNFFGTLTMTGSVGRITDISGGNELYDNLPLIIDTDMEIAHGRSGSPLIWRGYVIGLVTFFIGDNQTNSGSVASDAIIKTLGPLGYLPQS